MTSTVAPLSDRASPNEWPRIAVGFALVLLLALRVWLAFTLRVNSDEPQHLHIVWGWTQGLLPYRDLFDNHAPLFQILNAPLLQALGERADIVPWMRLATIPCYAIVLWFTYRLGRTLYDRRTGIIAVALVAFEPTFFSVSAEFRPDIAWAAAWMAALWIGVDGELTPKRAFRSGLLVGLAAAFSIKTALLMTAALIASGLLLLATTLQRRATDRIGAVRMAVVFVLGGAILPTTIAAAFASAGAWDAMSYCLTRYNTPLGLGRWSQLGWPALVLPLALPLFAWAIDRTLRDATDPSKSARRAWVLVTALVYFLLRDGYQPLIDRQDLLPLLPMLAPFVAAMLVRWMQRSAAALPGRWAVAALLVMETSMALQGSRPWQHEARAYTQELRTLLILSRPSEYVMDDKAEAIFRPRPLYWELENVALYRIAHGLMHDDVTGRLENDKVAVGVFDRERGADRSFVRDNYLTVAPHVEVAGKWLGQVRAGSAVDFDVEIPQRYAIVDADEDAGGTLDGTPYTSPRNLSAGPHRFVPSHDDDWALVWARASRMGYSPFPSAHAIHRNAARLHHAA